MKQLYAFYLLLVMSPSITAQTLSVTHLRCEYMQEPAVVDVTHPKLSWELESSRNNILQAAYRVMVADDSMLLQNGNANVWDSHKKNSAASIQVLYSGKPLQAAKKYFWKVMVWDNKGNSSQWSDAASWHMGLLTPQDWQKAAWIGYAALPDSNKILPFAHGKGKKEWGPRKDTLPMLRKDFIVARPVKTASVFISGLGHFEMSINGKKAGDHFLDPGWTQYSRHALYVSFDITQQLQQGKNAIGVMLGNGFYYIPGERYRKLTGGYGYPKMICRLLIEYADGSTSNIVSDASWKAAVSPVVFSSIYSGEDYDAGLEQAGWDMPGFNDSQWKPAVVTSGPPQLDAQTAAPLKIMQRFSAIKRTYLKPGVWIYDLGQNFSGIPSITVSGKKGDTVRIVPAELINEDGTANQKGTGSPVYFNYVLKGTGTEQWQPQFTYYGFRYLQVQGAVPAGGRNDAQLPVTEHIEGLHIRNAAAGTGSFVSSSQLFNRTFDLINWAIKSNTVSVFTDCPHREKLGWLEQTQLMGSSVQYNLDIASLNRKVIKDMIYAQTDEGLVPEIAPEYVHFDEPFRDSPEWGSAAIILPWYNYQWYADKQTLEAAYGMMQRYVTYLEKKSVDHILKQGLGDWYDLGPKAPGVSQLTPMGVTGTATYYYDVTIMIQVARLLGKQNDVLKYIRHAALVKDAFNRQFFNQATAQYATGSQTANAMALFMGLVAPENKKAVVDNLVKDIRQHNNALTAGDIGYRYVLRALEDAGRSDVIFDMNSRDDVPGYGFQLAHGATALTESWQAYGSVSNNHFMLGHLMEWLYAGLCGIRQATGSVAYKNIEIVPQPVGNISSAKADYHCPYGIIHVDWKKANGVFEMHVDIPANTSAGIYLPGSPTAIRTGSGSYTYSLKLK